MGECGRGPPGSMVATIYPGEVIMAASPQTTDRPRTTTAGDGYAPPATRTSEKPGRATAALVLGIISIPAALIAILGLVVGVTAIVLGALARGDIRRNRLPGGGTATLGIVLGSIGTLLALANMAAGIAAMS
jgi:Domain of unknown function (DUF4190)